MGFAFLITCFVYLAGAAIILVIIRKLIGCSYKIVALVGIVLLIAPFWRYIAVGTVFHFYEKTPLQEIYKTVDKPGSVYWEDNVWPGFNDYYTKAMIRNYLDGINLHTLALNGDDGNIYLFRAKPEDYSRSKALLPEIEKRQKEIDELSARGAFSTKEKIALVPFKEQYKEQLSQDIKAIMDRALIFNSPEDLPYMNYKIEFNKVPASPSFLGKLIISDKITITDNKTNELMAFSKRYLAYSGWIQMFTGNQPKFDNGLGYEQIYIFDNKVLFKYSTNNSNDGLRENRLRDRI